jgi:uncharacterized membrane protein (UPF0127 family)
MPSRVTLRRVGRPGEPVLARALLADRPLGQLLGWCFRPSPLPGEALLLPRCRAIHTAFMRFPIDLLYLRDGEVVALRAHLRPWRVALGPAGADAVELPAGTLARLDVHVGERIVAVPEPP